MRRKEPKFMQELHEIREKLAKKWGKMTPKEFLDSLHRTAKDFKARGFTKLLK